jgi:hypothetical protein
MTFFLVTNLMVVKGILLFLYGEHQAMPPVEGDEERARRAAREVASAG